MSITNISRRTLLGGMAGLGAASVGSRAFVGLSHAAPEEIQIKFDWLMSNGQIGDIVALQKGYYEEQGLRVTFIPGGPNTQTVPPVISGQALIGQFSGTGQASTAYGNGIPVKVFACGYQRGPFSYFSLPKNPVRKPEDLAGKRIGVQAVSRFFLDTLLSKYGIGQDQVEIVTVGFDMSPIVAGQVDVITGYITNTKALSVIGPDKIVMTEKETGILSYANVYFGAEDSLAQNQDVVTRLMAATAKGWGWAYENREEAVAIMCDAYPNLDREIEGQTVDMVMDLSFDEVTRKDGWGTFSPDRIQDIIDVFASAKRFEKRVPTVESFTTRSILDATADVRPKLG